MGLGLRCDHIFETARYAEVKRPEPLSIVFKGDTWWRGQPVYITLKNGKVCLGHILNIPDVSSLVVMSRKTKRWLIRLDQVRRIYREADYV